MNTATTTLEVKTTDMWGTPPLLARATVDVLADLLGWGAETDFMEPCAGFGAWVDALCFKETIDHTSVFAMEANPEFTDFPQDCLTQTWNTQVTIGNPPFSNWIQHIQHYKQQSRFVVQVLKSQAVMEVRTPPKGKCQSRAINGDLRKGLRYQFHLPRITFVPLAGQKKTTSDPMAMSVFVWDSEYGGDCVSRYDIARRMAELAEENK